MAAKMIQDKVRRAGLSDILGEVGNVNVQGEIQQKLDVYANEVLAHLLGLRDSVGVLASEENEEPMLVHKDSDKANYAIESHPEGKLRLLYEANPVAFLAEQAGGVAIDGQRRVLDIQPDSIHQRTPLVVGSRTELADFEQFVVNSEPCDR